MHLPSCSSVAGPGGPMSGTEVPRLFSFTFIFSNSRPFAMLQMPGWQNLVMMLPSVNKISPQEMHEGSCRDTETPHKSRKHEPTTGSAAANTPLSSRQHTLKWKATALIRPDKIFALHPNEILNFQGYWKALSASTVVNEESWRYGTAHAETRAWSDVCMIY